MTAREPTARDDREHTSISEEEVVLAARQAFTFLTGCAQGELADVKGGDRRQRGRHQDYTELLTPASTPRTPAPMYAPAPANSSARRAA